MEIFTNRRDESKISTNKAIHWSIFLSLNLYSALPSSTSQKKKPFKDLIHWNGHWILWIIFHTSKKWKNIIKSLLCVCFCRNYIRMSNILRVIYHPTISIASYFFSFRNTSIFLCWLKGIEVIFQNKYKDRFKYFKQFFVQYL